MKPLHSSTTLLLDLQSTKHQNDFPEIRMDQQLDVSKLSDADKKELNQILTNEAQKSNIQQSKWIIHLNLEFVAFNTIY